MTIDRGKIIICLMLGLQIITGCNNKTANKEADPAAGEKIAVLEGKKLVKQYCRRCHLPVAAKYLDKKTWLNHVLPAMAPKLGIQVFRKKQYYPGRSNSPASAISFSDWSKIVAYFKNRAPDSVIIPKHKLALRQNSEDSSMFSVVKPQRDESRHIAMTTLASYDSLTHKLYTSEADYHKTYSWNENLTPTFLRKLPITGVHANFYIDSGGHNHGVFTAIGSMKRINAGNGKLIDINFDRNSTRLIAKNLHRPVYALPGDFNKDGLRDWMVCAFGHNKGGLYLYEQKPDSTFKKKVIRGIPGAIEAETGDFNHDGWLDVMALFAQAREGIWMFINNKKGGFKRKNLLQFPAVYGSTSFQLADFNGDGKPDILYTCGDNADYSKILKPYHGVYIFINQGDYRYKQSWFYPVNGTTKAIAADFDNDGDLDVATISFFADLKNNSPTSFIYFRQDEPLHFIPATPRSVHKLGRWLCMDAADIDEDGDIDLILGNYSRGFLTQKKIKTSWNARLPFVELINKTNH